jgi:hypothetical protein
VSGVNSGEGVGGGGGGGGAPTYGNVAAVLATPTTPTTETVIGGPVRIQATDPQDSKATGLTLDNVTAATLAEPLQYGPVILWEGSAYVSGSSRAMRARLVLTTDTSGACVILFERDEGGGGGLTTAFRFSSSGSQFDARLYAFAYELGGGSSIVFPNNGGLYQKGATGAVEIKSRSEDGPLELYSETVGAFHPFRIYAAGETRGAAGTILVYGDDDGAGNFVERGRIMGDGVIEAPGVHVDATVYTNAAPPASTAPHGSYKVNLSGGDVAIPLPTPSASNLGRTIEVNQVVGGTDDMVFTPVSGLVEGGASITITGLASAPLASVTLRNIGGSTGWKIIGLA